MGGGYKNTNRKGRKGRKHKGHEEILFAETNKSLVA
jgi:hypothetical protein